MGQDIVTTSRDTRSARAASTCGNNGGEFLRRVAARDASSGSAEGAPAFTAVNTADANCYLETAFIG